MSTSTPPSVTTFGCLPHPIIAPTGIRRVLTCCKCQTFSPPEPYTFPDGRVDNNVDFSDKNCNFCSHAFCIDYCSPCIYALFWTCWSCNDKNQFDTRSFSGFEIDGTKCRTCRYPIDSACSEITWYWQEGGHRGGGEPPSEEYEDEYPVLKITWDEEEKRHREVNRWVVEGRLGRIRGELKVGTRRCVEIGETEVEAKWTAERKAEDEVNAMRMRGQMSQLQQQMSGGMFGAGGGGGLPPGWKPRIIESGPLNDWENLIGSRRTEMGW